MINQKHFEMRPGIRLGTAIGTVASLVLLLSTYPVFSQQAYSNNKFLLVLDVQQYWTDKAMSAETARKMVASINTLIKRTDPGKVIYIKTPAVSKILSISLKGIKVDTVYAKEFDRNLVIVGGNIFDKNEGDAFTSGELTDFLARNNAKEIIITGLMAEQCVYYTVNGGILRGFDVYVVPEAIGSKSEKSKQKVLKGFLEKGVKIKSLDEV